ncbi:MAG: YlxR family protein [Chloroflexi bacterium]|nr:YlxR family protein [Chloroflexota bacterium]
MAKKHVPMRTCVVCGRSYPKRELIRVVRTPEGRVELDLQGKKPGRGAYLCTDPACWDLRVAIPRLQRTLRAPLDEEARHALAEYANTLRERRPAVVGEIP